MAEVKLGTPVRFSAILTRRSVEVADRYERRWLRTEVGGWREGIVVGKRTLKASRLVQRAYRDYVFSVDDEPAQWENFDHFGALLVAFDVHARPVYVRVEDAEVLP